ncbi:type IV toxin-antitoxin system AbiEi family antitoxin domain-containing protein [Solirubrobacter ginsenosidimutans]|uniref:Type IV toxin-antitoxin system AbiEi family antitoxin domain-containing protein n=1 Tax=Solirubrobacter ginsenosidimutans TaxID=490573 RepID=A0A9X3MQ96_9ACTN|nr:type IV toxin-antitoxin system AbiEi family antitoxin domain-containing protein [Solirubrobacter ginsenosidimutans]MDA0159290.1 type IV toxin-antitoxin system AbiEi family antitoxin domain-containing protein [Solirubrobacter ginsenosidimutans]
MPGKVFTEVLEIARDQHGFVRTTDLREVGIDPKRLNDYWRRGLAERLGYGVYRLHLVPHDEWDEFMHAAVWPDGRGVLSHETALDLHDLCDVNPNHIDVTVPKAYRTHRDTPLAYRVHRRDLDADEITAVNGVPIVTPGRAIIDGIEAGLRPTLIEQAIDTAQRQAAITTAAAERLRELHEQR